MKGKGTRRPTDWRIEGTFPRKRLPATRLARSVVTAGLSDPRSRGARVAGRRRSGSDCDRRLVRIAHAPTEHHRRYQHERGQEAEEDERRRAGARREEALRELVDAGVERILEQSLAHVNR